MPGTTNKAIITGDSPGIAYFHRREQMPKRAHEGHPYLAVILFDDGDRPCAIRTFMPIPADLEECWQKFKYDSEIFMIDGLTAAFLKNPVGFVDAWEARQGWHIITKRAHRYYISKTLISQRPSRSSGKA